MGGDRQMGTGVPTGPGIQIPDKDAASQLGQPACTYAHTPLTPAKEELAKRTAELNK